jgi:SAM-dependent methyltransferase
MDAMRNVLAPRNRAAFYEEHQEWPPAVAGAVARHLRRFAPRPCRAAFLGCATGVNDALPFARLAVPGDRILASDLDPVLLDRLIERLHAEGLDPVDARKVDITRDLPALGAFDVVALLFVIHRVPEWRPVIPELAARVAPGGSLFISEFAGPSGVIYLSNENGGRGDGAVARLIRRTFELLPERFAPALKSTSIGPVLEALARELAPAGHEDFEWRQSLTVGEMFRKIEDGSYAPYFSLRRPEDVLARLRVEFASEWGARCGLSETIRLHRFTSARGC